VSIKHPAWTHWLDSTIARAWSGRCAQAAPNGRVRPTGLDSFIRQYENALRRMPQFYGRRFARGFETISVTPNATDGMILRTTSPTELRRERSGIGASDGDVSRSVTAESGFGAPRRLSTMSKCIFFEALYLVWKTTGDGCMDAAASGPRIEGRAFTAPATPIAGQRSWPHQARTHDRLTWDFLCDSESRIGRRDIMVIDLEKTHFGVFFGDNTECDCGVPHYLAEMLDRAERGQDAGEMRKLADELGRAAESHLVERALLHDWVAEDPEFRPDLGVDMTARSRFRTPIH